MAREACRLCASAGAFRTGPLSRHAVTNIDVIKTFLNVEVAVEPDGDGSRILRVRQA